MANVITSDSIMYPEIGEMNGVCETTFGPITSDHHLQQLITKRLHDAIMETESCETTLSELGYLHYSAVQQKDNKIDIHLYFDPAGALVENIASNGQKSYRVKPELIRLLNNRLFVAVVSQDGKSMDLSDVISVEEELCPTTKVSYDELGNISVRIKKGGAALAKREVVVVHCNMLILMAFLLDIDLHDPNYWAFASNTVTTKDKHGKKTDSARVLIDGNENLNAIWIKVTWSKNHMKFDPADCLDYLQLVAQSMHSKQLKMSDIKRDMEKSVRSDEYHKDKKKKKTDHKNDSASVKKSSSGKGLM